jgi:hypothetical protein
MDHLKDLKEAHRSHMDHLKDLKEAHRSHMDHLKDLKEAHERLIKLWREKAMLQDVGLRCVVALLFTSQVHRDSPRYAVGSICLNTCRVVATDGDCQAGRGEP